MSDSAHIDRKQSRSGNVSYSEPVLLHESSRTKQVFVPFYVKRSSGATELSAKIQTYKKDKHGWLEVEDKSITLKDSAARNLMKALKQHFAVAGEDKDGDYIAIRITDGVADVAELEPNTVADAVMGLLSQKDILEHITDRELGHEIITAFRGAIRLQELQGAVQELRQNLDSGVVLESVYQTWCDKHTWAFGNSYVVKDDIRELSPGDKVDLLLPSIIAGHRDIVELKRPDMDVLRYDKSHKNYYFSSDVSKAIGQCHRYLDVLHEEARKGLRDHPEIVAYHPSATVVIGRSHDWNDRKREALHGLNCRLSMISVMTYDQLAAMGERLVSVLANPLLPDCSQQDDEEGLDFDFDEEIPF